jgi:hypothetical protein
MNLQVEYEDVDWTHGVQELCYEPSGAFKGGEFLDQLSKFTSQAVPCLRRLVAGFPPWRSGFEPRSGHVGIVVDIAALGQVFSEYVGFPCQSFHRLLHTHHHALSSGASTLGQ